MEKVNHFLDLVLRHGLEKAVDYELVLTVSGPTRQSSDYQTRVRMDGTVAGVTFYQEALVDYYAYSAGLTRHAVERELATRVRAALVKYWKDQFHAKMAETVAGGSSLASPAERS